MHVANAIAIPPWIVQSVFVLALGGALTIICRSLARSLKAWAREQFESLAAQTRAVAFQVTPNGGTTMSNGDITKRIEEKIDVHVRTDLDVQRQQTKAIKALQEQIASLHADVQAMH